MLHSLPIYLRVLEVKQGIYLLYLPNRLCNSMGDDIIPEGQIFVVRHSPNYAFYRTSIHLNRFKHDIQFRKKIESRAFIFSIYISKSNGFIDFNTTGSV